MAVFDLHCHLLPDEFVEELNASHVGLTVGEMKEGIKRRYFHDNKSGMTVSYTSQKHHDMKARLEDMDSFGIDIQIVSLALPSIDRLPAGTAGKLARLANDEIHRLCSENPKRFLGFGFLPMQEPEGAVEELDRCAHSLGFKGLILPSNVDGEPLDSKRFWPIYERISALDLPFLLHPTIPAVGYMPQDYALDLTFGWPFDTSVAMARLVYSGIMEKFPNLRIVTSHSGGMVPFYRGRINYVQGQHADEKGFKLMKQPLDYFKKFYMDTAAFDPDALRCVYSFVGREKIVFGTDYPFGANEGRSVIELAIKSVKGMNLKTNEEDGIFHGNAKQLLRMN